MIDQISPSELAVWLQAATKAQQDEFDAKGLSGMSGTALLPVVLDVREPWEQQTASVRPDGFELVTIPMNEIPARLGELDAQRPIACLCHHGARSQRIALYLGQNGFDLLANIAGGIDAWSAQLDASVPRY